MTFFIIGTGRSGTTIMAQILNSHSKICVPHELQILFEYSGNGKRLYEFFKEGKAQYFNYHDFIKLIQTICPHNFDLFFDYAKFFREQRYPITDLKILVNDLFSEIAASKGKSIFGEQTPWYGQRIDILNELFPNAKYIHLVRDGRDVAISFARTPWWHKDVNLNLVRWTREVETIQNWEKTLLKDGQMLTIRYEDLVTDTEIIFKKLFQHLDLNDELDLIKKIGLIDYEIFKKLTPNKKIKEIFIEENSKKTFSVYNDKIQDWKNRNDLIFKLDNNTKALLNFFNYED